MQAGCLYSDLVVEGGQLVVALHQLGKQDALFPHDRVVFFNLFRRRHGHPEEGDKEEQMGKTSCVRRNRHDEQELACIAV